MLYPLIRANRALVSILIYPEHPLQAIAVSETVSIFTPLFNPIIYKKILYLTTSMLYCPTFANYILETHFKQYKIYNQAEICCILLFTLTFILNNNIN